MAGLRHHAPDHQQAPAELQALAQRRYDLTVLCLPDFDFVQDGCRRDDSFRAEQHAWTLRRLADMRVQPLTVEGSVQSRVAQVRQALHSLAVRPTTQQVNT
jgi:HTH-type transcriptional regulator, transcriptional repressor of NAD biosynthesis genes